MPKATQAHLRVVGSHVEPDDLQLVQALRQHGFPYGGWFFDRWLDGKSTEPVMELIVQEVAPVHRLMQSIAALEREAKMVVALDDSGRLGDHIRVRMNVADNDEFIVKVRNHGDLSSLAEGAKRKIGWMSEDCKALDRVA